VNAWTACLPIEHARALGSLRLHAGIEACEHDGQLWLRGSALDEKLELQLRGVPGADRFEVQTDGQLLRPQSRVPTGRMPSGPWTPLARWLSVEIPCTLWPGGAERSVSLRLVRSPCEEEAHVLVLEIKHWLDYCTRAPQVRLNCWQFALRADGRVVVRGLPMPPLPGERCTERDGVAVPVGWTFEPTIDAAVLQGRLVLEPGDLALFAADGSWEWLRAGDFVRATRSAVRASAGVLA